MVILWTLNRDLGPFPLKKSHHLLDVWMLTQCYLWAFNRGLPSQKLQHLLEVWMLTQDCFPWALNRSSSPFTAALNFLLFQILMLVSHLIEYFHQAVKFPVHFFREPCRLLLYLFLEVVINLSFQLLSLVILSVPSVGSISF